MMWAQSSKNTGVIHELKLKNLGASSGALMFGEALSNVQAPQSPSAQTIFVPGIACSERKKLATGINALASSMVMRRPLM